MERKPQADGPNAGLLLLLLALAIGVPIGIFWREIIGLIGRLIGW